VRGVVHQDGKAELARADHHDSQQEGKRVRPPYEQRHAAEDQCPGMQHEQRTHRVGAGAQGLDLLGCQ
jgi:hypothetical protein